MLDEEGEKGYFVAVGERAIEQLEQFLLSFRVAASSFNKKRGKVLPSIRNSIVTLLKRVVGRVTLLLFT